MARLNKDKNTLQKKMEEVINSMQNSKKKKKSKTNKIFIMKTKCGIW